MLAFDKGLVSFADDGRALLSPKLGDPSRAALEATESGPTGGHKGTFVTRCSNHC